MQWNSERLWFFDRNYWLTHCSRWKYSHVNFVDLIMLFRRMPCLTNCQYRVIKFYFQQIAPWTLLSIISHIDFAELIWAHFHNFGISWKITAQRLRFRWRFSVKRNQLRKQKRSTNKNFLLFCVVYFFWSTISFVRIIFVRFTKCKKIFTMRTDWLQYFSFSLI